jgi:hypothetical protein
MSHNKILQTELNRKNSNAAPVPGPWPWYVLFLIGYTVSGFLPWLMIAWGLYQRGRKGTAGTVLAVNFMVLICTGWWMMTLKLVWSWVSIWAYGFNSVWIVTAIIYQKSIFGGCPRRYHVHDWKVWVKPIVIGAIIGFCIGTIFSIIPAFESRVHMKETLDSLDRQTVLWSFFSYSFIGLIGGLVLGLWWAGEGKRFRISHVITYLSAFVLTICFSYLLWWLLQFVLHKGSGEGVFQMNRSNWAVIPPWTSGVKKFLIDIEKYNMMPLIVIPLLLGAPSRMRDFAKRSLLIPLTFIISLPMVFTSHLWWEMIQDQVIYEINSDDPVTQSSAFDLAEILITRYPNHLQWPHIAEKLARFRYKNERFKQSRLIYKQLIDKHQNSFQWYWTVKRARAAVVNPGFGKLASATQLQIPMVDYQTYLTHNWMALLSVIRYWEGADTPESEVVIRLKELSKSSDKIQLPPLINLAALDDAATSFGYDMILFRSDLARIRELIKAGFPVIHQNYKYFNILFGIDDNRSAIYAYSFAQLSKRLRNENRREAKEILAIKKEGQGESQKRLMHIANESYIEYSTDYWQNPSLRYFGPISAIIVPRNKIEKVAKVLNEPFNKLKDQSDGYLASLIALSYLNHGDPMYAIEWAKIGAEKIDDPLPSYVAYLARVWWESRNKISMRNLRLEIQFPELTEIFDYFNALENKLFLQKAQKDFEQGFNDNDLPWIVVQEYLPLLDRSAPDELNQISKLMHMRVSFDPSSYLDWIFLANISEWADDLSGSVHALKGAISSNPTDSDTKIRLAFEYVQLKQYEAAKNILKKIDPGKERYEADYHFCLGALAEWEGDTDTALEKYAVALGMRRYKPIYHLRYGKLLMKQGYPEKARAYLEWAARTEAKNTSRNEALNLLAKMNK